MKRRVSVCLLLVALVLAATGGQWLLLRARPAELSKGAASDHGKAEQAPERAPRTVRTAEVPPHRPAGYHPSVASGVVDHHGNATQVACMTCHATRTPDLSRGAAGGTPKDFHQGIAYAHGGQSCLSCHHSEDYDALRLADGRKLAFTNAQNLCAQCHGPQTRDYLNGSHGGMRGYWDQTKGTRTRNTCTDCHDPHAPAFPKVTPVFAPRDGAARQQAERDAARSRNPSSKQPAHE